MKRNTKKAFTLIEMVIVIAVIAVLSAIVIPVYAHVTDKAKREVAHAAASSAITEFIADYEGVLDASDIYAIQSGDYYALVEDGQLGELTKGRFTDAYEEDEIFDSCFRNYYTNAVVYANAGADRLGLYPLEVEKILQKLDKIEKCDFWVWGDFFPLSNGLTFDDEPRTHKVNGHSGMFGDASGAETDTDVAQRLLNAVRIVLTQCDEEAFELAKAYDITGEIGVEKYDDLMGESGKTKFKELHYSGKIREMKYIVNKQLDLGTEEYPLTVQNAVIEYVVQPDKEVYSVSLQINFSDFSKLTWKGRIGYTFIPDELNEIGDEAVATVETDGTEPTQFDNFAKTYFNGLTENFGNNEMGSCTYVALGMLLSYYDTYLNDDIIPEGYDVVSEGTETDMIERDNSPGIAFIEPTDRDIESILAYSDFVESMAGTGLHEKLLDISQNNDMWEWGDTEADPSCALSFSEMITVADLYLQNEVGYVKNTDYTVRTYFAANEGYREYVVQKLQEGIPVLLVVGREGAETSHAVIAYDYDEETDKIYCHFGWNAETTHVCPEDIGYTIYTAAMVLTFTGEHSCSDNYKVGDSEYCYCDNEIVTTIHYHDYSTYENLVDDPTYGNERHTCTCDCGATITEAHEFELEYYSALFHIETCTKCGGTGSTSRHTYSTNAQGANYCTGCGYVNLIDGPIVTPDSKENEHEIS